MKKWKKTQIKEIYRETGEIDKAGEGNLWVEKKNMGNWDGTGKKRAGGNHCEKKLLMLMHS